MSGLISNTLQIAGVATLGLITSRTSMWASQKLENSTGISIGKVLSTITQNCGVGYLKSAAHTLNMPLTFVAEKIKDAYLMEPYENDRINLKEFMSRSQKLERFLKVVLAPVFEELAFRGGVQILGGVALESVGAPPAIAQGVSMVIGNTLFALAHLDSREDFNSTTFSNMAVGGATDTIICHNYGLIGSIASHALSNLSNEWIK